MKTVGDRIAAAREAKGLNQTQLAKAVGISSQAIQQLESGETRGTKHLVAIAAVLDVTPESLQGVSDGGRKITIPSRKTNIVEIDGAEFAKVPVYDIRFAAGHGSEGGDEEPVDHYLVSMNLLRVATDAPISSIAIFQADGDSMSSTINNRDWVFVDLRKTKLTNPGIYALVYDGERFLKRVTQHLETRAVSLISDNPAYKPQSQTIKKPDRLTVIGRVFMSIRRH
jgi:phage repressor protein C with HTH and peptisase S24 domain